MEQKSKKLARQFKRYLGSEDAEIIIPAAAQFLNAQTDADKIEALRNFPVFAGAVDKAYAEYEDRLKVAARNIEISSRELTAAYRDLENLNASVNAMLDSLGQGLLFFDTRGICSSVFSKSCLEMLETDPSHKPLPEVLKFTPEQEKHFYSWLAVVMSGNSALDFDDMKQLIPGEIMNSQWRVIELDYKPMYATHDDQLTGILLIATDVTHAREIAGKINEVQRTAQKVQQIARNRNAFHGFVVDLYSFISMAEKLDAASITKEDREILLRGLHTYKGQASAFSLREISEKIHEIEVSLRKARPADIEKIFEQGFSDIEGLLEHEKDFARNLFGLDFMTQGKVRSIELSKINDLLDFVSRHVKNKDEQEALRRTINKEFLSMPIFGAFLSFERELARLAEQQGKPIPNCIIEGNNLPIILSSYEHFFNALIHFARNIIDHGIEKPELRVEAGKPREGQVRINIEKESADENFIKISIGDDGVGIDPDLIRQKLAEERNLDTSAESDAEVIKHIFDLEFSLKKDISILSGQGVGMNALQDAVLKMGGTVSIKSDWKNHRGTTVTFYLPYEA